MSDPGPWGNARPPEPPPPPRRPPYRLAIWLALMAAMVGGVWLLARAFPGQLRTLDDQGSVLRIAGILLILSMGVFSTREVRWAEKARHVAIWIGVIAVLAIGLTYRDEVMEIANRVRGEFASSYGVSKGARQLVITASEGGGFYVMGKVNGQPVRFLIDTGASDTVLSPDDAVRIGINTASLRFDHMAETANGTGYGARYAADKVEVGPIAFNGVPMVVNQAPMSASLLGMSVLSRLESFQVRGRQLYLTAKP